jgi:hypothetical protein
MKTKHLALIIAAVCLLLPARQAHGSTMTISNLGVPWPDGGIGDIQAIFPEQEFGVAVTNGSNSAALQSVTVEHIGYPGADVIPTFRLQLFLLGARHEEDSYFDVSFVADLGNPVVDPRPTQWPGETSFVTYTPSTVLNLDPNTTYLIVATDVINETGLLFAPAGNYTVTGDWSLVRRSQFINQGFGWERRSAVYDLKVEVIATTAADTTPPTITCPADITVPATTGAGATVSFSISASDDSDPNPTVSSTPASGSTFPIGTTTVNGIATDASGNTGTCSFTVTVKGASEQITDLIALVTSLTLKPSLANSLIAKLQDASTLLGSGNVTGACGKLNDFIRQVTAQVGKGEISPAQADLLIQAAIRIRAVLGC